MRRAVILLTALALAGCNRADTVEAPDRRVAITIGEYRYDPQNVRVQRGRVTFAVVNEGSEAHNFQVRGRGRKRGRIPTLKPGMSGEMTIRLRPGAYTMYCGIGRHEELGEYGTLTVTR